MAVFHIDHPDPLQTARLAAVRSGTERDPALKQRAKQQSMAERLREGFRLAEFASRLSKAGR